VYLTYIQKVLSALNSVPSQDINRFIATLLHHYTFENNIFIIGNGGSAANASHFCEDLSIGTLSDFKQQKRFRVYSLTDNSPAITAWGNDDGYDNIFKNQLQNLIQANDLLIAISGSGNSKNILNAVDYVNGRNIEQNINTFSFTGFDGGLLKNKTRYGIHVVSDNMGIVESVHDIIFHYVISVLKEKIK